MNEGNIKYKLVVFDAFGTLFKCEGCHQKVINEFLGKKHSLNMAIDFHKHVDIELNRLINEKVQKNEFEDFYSLNMKAFLSAIKKYGLKTTEKEVKKYVIKSLNIFKEESTLYPEVYETLNLLKSNGLRMAVVSNGLEETLVANVEKWSLNRYFSKEELVTSDSAKSYKPAEKIFKHVLNLKETKPTEAVMVGDSLFTDIYGAKRIGMTGVYFKHTTPSFLSGQFSFNLKVKPDFVINNLKEVVKIVLNR